MYAVVESGGKQYRVELGQEIAVDRLEAQPGETIQFERVLLVADDGTATVGTPIVAGATVSADVVRRDRGEKIVVFKYRPKARHRVKQGSRADLTVLRIADIVLDGKSAAQDAEAARTERRQEEAATAEAAVQQAAVDKTLAARLAVETAAAEAEARAKAAPRPAARAAALAKAVKSAAKAVKPDAKAAKPAAKAVKPDAKAAKPAAKAVKPGAKTPKAAVADAKPAGKPATRTQAPPPAEKPNRPKKKDE